MNRMEGMRFTQNAFLWEIFGGKYYAAACAGCGWLPVEKIGMEIAIQI